MDKKRKKSIDKSEVQTGAIVSDKVRSYENDPTFLKRAEEAKAYLKKVGLPKEFGNRKIY